MACLGQGCGTSSISLQPFRASLSASVVFPSSQDHPLVMSRVTGEGRFPPPCRSSRFIRLFPVDIYQTALLFPFSHKKHFVSLGADLPKQLTPDPGQKLRFSAQQTREGRLRENGKEKERRKRSDAISDRGSAAFQKEQ